MSDPETPWEAFVAFRQYPGGPKPPALTMRRKVPEGWEYRLPTPEEDADYVSSEAW